MTNWNPVTHPYRVSVIRDSDRHVGMGGWDAGVRTFASETEARACFESVAVTGPVRSVELQVARNPETWTRNGRWEQLDSRRRQRRR